MNRLVLACLTIFVVFAAAPRADALICSLGGCSCDVSATTLAFGNINPLSGSQTAEGEITVDCTGLAELFPTMLVRMQSGTNGAISARKMKSAAGDLLDYNIYTLATGGSVWGNGTTGSTVVVSGGLLALGRWSVTRRVYGVVAPTTSTRPGNYSDSVVVRIDW